MAAQSETIEPESEFPTFSTFGQDDTESVAFSSHSNAYDTMIEPIPL